jgi:hypothetical protein
MIDVYRQAPRLEPDPPRTAAELALEDRRREVLWQTERAEAVDARLAEEDRALGELLWFLPPWVLILARASAHGPGDARS